MLLLRQLCTVFASGEVGPYGFDVVGSEDPDALVTWLRENSYLVTEAMEPLIDLYVEEEFVFPGHEAATRQRVPRTSNQSR